MMRRSPTCHSFLCFHSYSARPRDGKTTWWVASQNVRSLAFTDLTGKTGFPYYTVVYLIGYFVCNLFQLSEYAEYQTSFCINVPISDFFEHPAMRGHGWWVCPIVHEMFWCMSGTSTIGKGIGETSTAAAAAAEQRPQAPKGTLHSTSNERPPPTSV